MPELKNPRWEMYAKGMARGLNRRDAYAQAGYKPNAKCGPYRMSSDKRISDRVNELINEKNLEARKTLDKISKKLLINTEWVLTELVGIHKKAMSRRNYAAAIRAVELIGKELGMFVERKDVTVKYSDLSDEELDAAIRSAFSEYTTAETAKREGDCAQTAH